MYGKPSSGGVSHVPPGWDFWAGLVGNSKYYDYDLSINGKREHHGSDYSIDYLTDVIGKKAHSFLDMYISRRDDGEGEKGERLPKLVRPMVRLTQA